MQHCYYYHDHRRRPVSVAEALEPRCDLPGSWPSVFPGAMTHMPPPRVRGLDVTAAIRAPFRVETEGDALAFVYGHAARPHARRRAWRPSPPCHRPLVVSSISVEHADDDSMLL